MGDDEGLLIVIEGIDGSGSTSQGTQLTKSLRKLRKRVVFTHEPSEGPVGSIIRLALTRRIIGAPPSAYLNGIGDDLEGGAIPGLDSATLALLYAADRRDHTVTAIDPNLRAGVHVITDRYLLSSLAYQGLTHDLDWLLNINSTARVPDLTIYLDVSVQHSMLRMKADRFTRDLFEEEQDLERVRAHYEKLIQADIPQLGDIVRVDASRPFKEVARRVLGIVRTLIDADRDRTEGDDLPLFSGSSDAPSSRGA